MAEGGQLHRSLYDSLGKASCDADESFCNPCKNEDTLIAYEGYCQKCDEYLCGNCLEVHRKLKITRTHVIFNYSYTDASGDADESFCDPCKSQDAWIAVKGYCQECNEYLCEPCLGVHRKLKITKTHVILDNKQLSSEQISINTDYKGSVSKDDQGPVNKDEQGYVKRDGQGPLNKTDDEPGCMTQMQTSYRNDMVQDIPSWFQKTKEFKDIDHHLQQLFQKLVIIVENNLKNTEQNYINILREVSSVRKKINTYLDLIQTNMAEEAIRMKKTDETELKRLQDKHRAMTTEIQTILHYSNVNGKTINKPTKQVKDRLVTMEKEINRVNQSQQQKYDFQISNEIEKLMINKTPLGKLSRKSLQKIWTNTKKRESTRRRMSSKEITATYIRSIDVKTETDNKICRITNSTLLSTDRVVITDENNTNIKLIDTSNNTVVSQYNTSSEPWGVTALSTNMVAVTLPNEGRIQIFDVTSTFTIQREIKVHTACFGIAYKDVKYAVSCKKPGRIQILDMQGNMLHVIQPKRDILRDPDNIAFGHDNNTVIVADCSTNIVSVVTFKGEILRKYKHDTLRRPQGIVITGDGVLFVCNFNGGRIHALSPIFETCEIIIRNDVHVVNPRSITFCEINHRLYISNSFDWEEGMDNQIQVYDLKFTQ